MREKRISNPRHPSGRAFQRFLGVSLSAGRAERTALSILDYYPDENRFFLSELITQILTEEFATADEKFLELIEHYSADAQSLTFDCPISLPSCLIQPERANDEISWMRKQKEAMPKKRPHKNSTPYTQRCVDLFFALEFSGTFEVHHALGGNLAPLTARATYLAKSLKMSVFETNPKIVVWRVGHELGLRKSHLKNHRSAVLGQSARREWMRALIKNTSLFIYEQDLRKLVDQVHAFDSCVAALMGYWNHRGLSEDPPTEFPTGASWMQVPREGAIFGSAPRVE